MKFIIIPILIFCAFSASAEVHFSDLDLADESKLLFRATTASPGVGDYQTLFLADVEIGSLEQVTFFPEKIMLAGKNGEFQIQNRFGIFRTDKDLANMALLDTFSSFVTGSQIQTGKINAGVASPDGAYLAFLNPTSYGFGSLMLYDATTGQEHLISENVEYSLSKAQAVWSPDSNFFIYSRGGEVYYYSVLHLEEDRVIAEDFRTLGAGTTASVSWGSDNDLYFISGSLVYKIRSTEFFTRSLYSRLLGIGGVAGKIPFEFDPNFDEFWVSPDGEKLLLGKGGRNVFLFFLQADDYLSTGDIQSLPYLFLPRNTRLKRVLWSENDRITLLTGSIEHGDVTTKVFRLDLSVGGSAYAFTEQQDGNVLDLVLNDDGTRVAVLRNTEVLIKNYANWSVLRVHPHEEPIHALWHTDSKLIIAGTWITEVLDVTTGDSQLVSLSQPVEHGFSDDSQPLVGVGEKVYTFGINQILNPVETEITRPAEVASDSYRIYLENLTSASYLNMVMVRKIKGFGTEQLFDNPITQYESFPTEQQAVDYENFSHGSRIRRREVALVFNAIDTVEGLTEILNTLNEYGLRCTFFINGEFIRRHPGAVAEIAESGHEVGSLFYAYFNMTDSSFKIDKDFIKQGLARNEDDYFSSTGNELSLLWHAPYYFANTDIVNASREMNYTYVGRDIDPLDWVSAEDPTPASFYLDSSSLVERILKLKKPGSIIPLRIGAVEPGRDDYLFHRLDALINGLISLGYSIVPVSTLIQHAK